MWRVAVDPDLCEANARCVGIAPLIFALDDDSVVAEVISADVDDADAARNAARACPKQAITVMATDEDSPT
ncbi:MAG: ferredoxin [Ilumatobacteraceae bacterium]